MSKVIITGATGYIAQYTIKFFLDKGHKVIGTVRSQEKGETVEKKFNNGQFSFEVINDFTNYDHVAKILQKHKDLEIFLHTAAATNIFTTNPEEEILIPNINATKTILNALYDNVDPNFKKFGFTSSISAFHTSIMGPEPVDSDSWSEVTMEQGKLNGFFGYSASKKYSEKEIIKFFESKTPSWSYFNIGLSVVVGTPLFPEDSLSGAPKLVIKPLQETEETLQKFDYLTITVEDAAKALYIGCTSDKVINERLLLSSNRLTEQDVLDIGNEFKELQGKVPKGTPRTDEITKSTNVDISKPVKLLGFEPEFTLPALKKLVKFYIETKEN